MCETQVELFEIFEIEFSGSSIQSKKAPCVREFLRANEHPSILMVRISYLGLVDLFDFSDLKFKAFDLRSLESFFTI